MDNEATGNLPHIDGEATAAAVNAVDTVVGNTPIKRAHESDESNEDDDIRYSLAPPKTKRRTTDAVLGEIGSASNDDSQPLADMKVEPNSPSPLDPTSDDNPQTHEDLLAGNMFSRSMSDWTEEIRPSSSSEPIPSTSRMADDTFPSCGLPPNNVERKSSITTAAGDDSTDSWSSDESSSSSNDSHSKATDDRRRRIGNLLRVVVQSTSDDRGPYDVEKLIKLATRHPAKSLAALWLHTAYDAADPTKRAATQFKRDVYLIRSTHKHSIRQATRTVRGLHVASGSDDTDLGGRKGAKKFRK